MKARAKNSFQVIDQNVVKLDRFDGTNFSRWNDKLIFMLTALKIAYDDDSNQLKVERKKRVDDEIKEDTRNLQKRNVETISKVNYIDEKKPNSRGKKYSGESSCGRNKRKLQEFSDSNATKIKTNKSCYHYGKKAHFKRDCRYRKKNALIAMISDLHIDMITELNMSTATKTFDWWYNSGATVHVYNDKSQFKTFEKVIKGYEVMMENNDTTKVLGKGTVEISFTFEMKLMQVNVLFVLDIMKNLISANLLCTKGIKAALESDKVVFSKNGAFSGQMVLL
ncbi:hypothetical protein NE237_024689 [Protea cynaroides]|uniref:Retrovirus-related Pol polyprotein from transposon TNT 1-94-like beta-barrel domain-containing protein n=1 Tax=Protea cynaroides TaxID=273540 RepID=A0A9Q0H3G4_9MAGN|nr:hypothetical protein NE237_024689 [Protea cynaroides]